MQADKVSVIIPCYWATNLLERVTETCINSFLETTGWDRVEPWKTSNELIVIDDGSPLEGIRGRERALVRLYTRAANGGYAAAVNTGLRHASGEYLIICNNDIEFIQPDWLEHLLKPLENGYDISSIRTTDSDGWTTEDKMEEDAKFGSLWAMKRSVYESLGGLDETFGRGYFEDLDYHERAKQAGFKIAKNHAGLAHHIGKATFKEVDTEDTSYIRAREHFIKKWGKVW